MFWLHLVLLAAVAGGFALLVVGTVNRVHAFPLSYAVLHRIRQGHDLLIVGFALAIFAGAGWFGPQLLRGGQLDQVGFGWRFVGVVCLSSLAVSLLASCARALRPRPVAWTGSRSRVVDIAAELGRTPVGPGPYAGMTRLPLNEIFQLELSEKEFRLPRLPLALDGLSILHLSDIHLIGTLDRPWFERALELAREQPTDLVVFTGDLIDDMRYLDWLPTILGEVSAPLGCWFILGNHDWYQRPLEIRQAMESLGWQDVAGRTAVIRHAGVPLAIAGDETPWMGTHPSWAAAPPDAFRLLLSHTPDNFHWACRHNVDLMLSGHNHGGQIKLPLFGPVYSPSRFGCRYADGVFWKPPTLLHVSRGLAGKHPLRWRCRPEVTRVILRASQ